MSKTIRLNRQALVEEHRNLLKTLTLPTKSRLEKEAKKQKKDLNEYLKMK
jgi:hypothetical protein